MNNDLGFLAIFIILPTILIVSGFWLILIVRSDLRLRAAPETTTSDEVGADEAPASPEVILAELPGDLDDSVQPVPQADDVQSPSEDADEAVADADDEHEVFWTPEPKPMPAPSLEAATLAQVDELDDAPETTEPETSTGVHLGDTANLPHEDELELPGTASVDSDTDAESDDESGRPQRQPAARMVPSTEHVKRRTGQQARRAPIINPRSSDRDEDAVEGPDGG